jgi:hypothetical protein
MRMFNKKIKAKVISLLKGDNPLPLEDEPYKLERIEKTSHFLFQSATETYFNNLKEILNLIDEDKNKE